ncbi:hypothetical protein ACQEU3_46580 [Spirillospora sp. CA-253888]
MSGQESPEARAAREAWEQARDNRQAAPDDILPSDYHTLLTEEFAAWRAYLPYVAADERPADDD